MTFSFDETIINDGEISKENFIHPKFIGYLNKYGESIDYSHPFGLGGHDNNKITDIFVYYFYYRKLGIDWPLGDDLDKEIEELNKYYEEIEKKEFYRNFLELKDDIKKDSYLNKYKRLEGDLYNFFYNCYENNSFFSSLGKKYNIMTEYEFYTKYCEYSERTQHYYEYYCKDQLMIYFKEILIQYLGYHSVERIPRTITTSETNVYSTFYNYLLNDFKIVRIPKMNYNKNEKMYVEHNQSDFLLPDSELRLKDEIQSIKRLVPLKERYKYYR